MYVGEAKWQSGASDFVFEPDECTAEFETEEEEHDLTEGYCSATCPECGAVLCQQDDHITEIEGKPFDER
jgi:hypothetical protein